RPAPHEAALRLRRSGPSARARRRAKTGRAPGRKDGAFGEPRGGRVFILLVREPTTRVRVVSIRGRRSRLRVHRAASSLARRFRPASRTARIRMTSSQPLRWVPATLAACALLVSPATGQTIRSPYRYLAHRQAGGLLAGYIAADRGQVELGPGSGPVLGGRYTIRLSGPFAAEAEAAFFPTSRYVLRVVPDTVA